MRALTGLFLILAACDDPPADPRGPPVADALECDPFPFAPAETDKRITRCAASEVVQGVAVEKAWSGDAVRYTLLLQEQGAWTRQPLGDAVCGGEVPAGCSHDEMFRRSFQIARDGDRIAIFAPPSGPLNPRAPEGNQTQAYGAILVPDADPYIWWVRPAPASAAALLETLPRTLEEAYRLTLDGDSPVQHANAAFDAGNPAPRAVLEPLIPEADCDGAPEGAMPIFATRWDSWTRRDDPWTTDVVGPWTCPPEPDAQDTLVLGAACREAIAACGLELPERVPVSVFNDPHSTPGRPRALFVASDAPAALLAPGLSVKANVYSGPPLFLATRENTMDNVLHSRTGLIWLGPDEVRAHRVHAPVSVAPRSPEGSDWKYPEGTRWCFIPPDACPTPALSQPAPQGSSLPPG